MFEGAHRPVERPALQGGRRSRPRRAGFRAQASRLKTQDFSAHVVPHKHDERLLTEPEPMRAIFESMGLPSTLPVPARASYPALFDDSQLAGCDTA
jgi:hypothetical protein